MFGLTLLVLSVPVSGLAHPFPFPRLPPLDFSPSCKVFDYRLHLKIDWSRRVRVGRCLNMWAKGECVFGKAVICKSSSKDSSGRNNKKRKRTSYPGRSRTTAKRPVNVERGRGSVDLLRRNEDGPSSVQPLIHIAIKDKPVR